MKQNRLLLIGLYVLSFTLIAWGHPARPAAHSFKLNSGGSLVFKARNADLIVRAWEKEEASVREFINDQELQNLDIAVSSAGNTLTVTEDDYSHTHKNVCIEIFVPKKCSIEAHSKNGDLGIKGIEGNVAAATANGDVELIVTKGALNLATSNGDIKVTDCEGNATFVTAHGDIDAQMKGNVKANSSAGDMKLAITDGKVVVQSASGDISVSYFGKNYGIQVETANGDIKLHLPTDMKASLQLRSNGGEIKVNNRDVTTDDSGRQTYHTDLHGGGEKVSCSTAQGDITLFK
jgi:DUF4097 and DUF4098 domain-containing protein YvlB